MDQKSFGDISSCIVSCIAKFIVHSTKLLNFDCSKAVQSNLDYPDRDYPDCDYPDFSIIRTFSLVPFSS